MLYSAIRVTAALRGAAGRQDWDRVHEGLTSLGIFLAIEAEAAVRRAMGDVRAAYSGSPAGLRRPQLHAILDAHLGQAVADRALVDVSDGLGDITAGELETRLLGIML